MSDAETRLVCLCFLVTLSWRGAKFSCRRVLATRIGANPSTLSLAGSWLHHRPARRRRRRRRHRLLTHHKPAVAHTVSLKSRQVPPPRSYSPTAAVSANSPASECPPVVSPTSPTRASSRVGWHTRTIAHAISYGSFCNEADFCTHSRTPCCSLPGSDCRRPHRRRLHAQDHHDERQRSSSSEGDGA